MNEKTSDKKSSDSSKGNVSECDWHYADFFTNTIIHRKKGKSRLFWLLYFFFSSLYTAYTAIIAPKYENHVKSKWFWAVLGKKVIKNFSKRSLQIGVFVV